MLIGTIDLYHFFPPSLPLTFPGGHKIRANKTYWLHILANFVSDQG